MTESECERKGADAILNTFDDDRRTDKVKPAGRASERQKGNVIVLGAQRSMGAGAGPAGETAERARAGPLAETGGTNDPFGFATRS